MTSKASRRTQWHQDPLQYGEAISVTLLLSDWDKFGLSERVCFHFDRIETLTATSDGESNGGIASDDTVDNARREHERNISASGDGVCGVVSLLECIPKTVKYRRRDVRNAILSFNMLAQQVRQEAKIACFEPSQLPLRLSPATRVYFAYEVTKVAFCLDASPPLLATFGNDLGRENDVVCSLDRLEDMTSVFFRSLVAPIVAPWLANPKGWRPILAVTVLAVYPNESSASDTSILVRDFRVFDNASAERLSREIAQWALKEVEGEIAHRMGRIGSNGMDPWDRPTLSTSLRDIFDAGDVALSLLPSRARPCIVLATDCRSVACESILDLFQDSERVDTPLIVLDLSSSNSHSVEPKDELVLHDKTSFLTHDPGNSSNFPLHLSDDSESLFGVCQATGGAFLDAELLDEASRTLAGKVKENSPIASDSFFTFKRRALRPNAVQWYTLFSLSPLSPCLHPSWGKLAPPKYIRERMGMFGRKQEFPFKEYQVQDSRLSQTSTTSLNVAVSNDRRPVVERSTFSIYVVSPVRVKGLLLMRIKEGYRAKQYGSSTQDPDKVSIQFKLPLEFGTVLHYELSYKALDTQSPFVGVANVKIELSGERSFIQAVKNDFISNLAPAQHGRLSTIAMRASAKLCKVLRGMRREDCLQAYLCPLSWTEKLSTSDSPFARRLGTLSQLQRRRHFRLDQFDVLCVGRMPYEQGEEYLILSEFIDFDSGEQELFDSLSDWSTQTIKDKMRYVKKTSSARDDLVAYCVFEVTRSGSTSRIFTVTVETFGGSSAVDRLALLSSLKATISMGKDVMVLPKPMNGYLVGLRDPLSPELKLLEKHRFLESHFHHECWSGGPNSELLALLTKRRNEVGKFWFLHSSEKYSLFAKLVIDDGGRLAMADFTDKASNSASSELYQVQYQIAVVSGSIVIDMHVEREQGVFFVQNRQTSRFHELFDRVRVRDQECGRALSSRTSLLSFLSTGNLAGNQRYNVERLVKYASKLLRKLRFFHSGAASANKILEELTSQAILSSSSTVQVKVLPLEDDVIIDDVGRGIWFLIQFDGHTMGFAHLASNQRQEKATDDRASFMFRELTIFSIGVSDLYCKRDLIADDDSTDDHISEYMCVSEFADAIEALHGRNYARAAYLALRSDGKGEKVSFDASDFQYAVDHCIFSEFKSVTLVQQMGESDSHNGGSDLFSRAIIDALTPVPGDKYCLYYSGDESRAPLELLAEDSDVDAIDGEEESTATGDNIEFEFSDDGVDSTDHYMVGESQPDVLSSHGFSLSSDGSDVSFRQPDSLPPIFVRFLLDDEVVALGEIPHVGRTATLKAQISLFDSEGSASMKVLNESDAAGVPEIHLSVVLRLRALLDAYVAEELLERLRQYGQSVSRSELRTVKECLRKARQVLKRDVPIKFYDGKTDSLVHPEGPTGADAVAEAFPLLCSELQKSGTIVLRPTSASGFFVIATSENATSLSYWCFVTLKIHEGVVNVKLYHPEGKWRAAEALSNVLDHIGQTMHRVNQMLLLRSLHRNRLASSYLIPRSDDYDEWKSDEQDGTLFSPGSFACPVKFKTSFPLYERCVASQVVLSLEASVLHSFAVSNRRGVFVYKDESEAIFYMKLRDCPGNEGVDHVEFLVYGLVHPGPSVTSQLRTLLQRKVHALAVEALSSVLTKNPHLKWKSSDVSFLRSFQESYQYSDDERLLSSYDTVVEYVIPDYMYDPIMLLVLFRQNICGSTFFHRLQETSNESTQLAPSAIQEEDGTDTLVPFDPHEFTLFYNHAPSPLDSFQPVSTLTAKGAEFSRKAGIGIAIIDVSLVDRDGQTVGELNVGQSLTQRENIQVSEVILPRLHRVEPQQNDEAAEYRIRVSIADTALNREALHGWVELTLDQVLVAWVVERNIEQKQLGLLQNPKADAQNASSPDMDRQVMIDSLVPGFPQLFDILQGSHDLPHPAIETMELGGVLKASSVASVALNLLEACVSGLMASKETPLAPEALMHVLSQTIIIRLSRTQQPKCVNLVWDSPREKATAIQSKSGIVSNVQDSPIDCPEYLCYYCFNHYSSVHDGVDDAKLAPSSMCFREVMVDDKADGRKGVPFVDALLSCRESNPSGFSRSLVFVLSVKRNRRMLLTYNWNPNIFKSVTSQLRDINTVQRNVAHNTVDMMQKRCLRALAPHVTKHDPPESRKVETSNVEKKEESKVDPDVPVDKSGTGRNRLDRRPPSRRIPRPTSVRRPKLIGKSVEGAAVQAMAASRARASASRGSSPFQKKNKAVASKEMASKDTISSTGTEVEPKPEGGRQRPSNQDEAAELSVVLKRSAANVSYAFASPFQHSRSTQQLIDKHWTVKPERPLSQPVRDFLLSRSIHLWSSACVPFGFPARMMKDLSGYFAQFLNMSKSEVNLLQLDAPSHTESLLSPSSTIIVELKNVKQRKLCVVLRTSLKYSTEQGEPRLLCHAWMLFLNRTAGDYKPARAKKKHARRPVERIERKATLVDKKLCGFTQTVNIEIQFFNFASFLIQQSLHPWKESLSPSEMLSLLQEMIKRYPFERQVKMDGLEYCAHQAPIVLASYRNKFIDLYYSNKLFNHLSSNAASYEMILCDLNGLCFRNTIPVEETTTLCFVTRDPRDVGTLQLVMLTRLEGQHMNQYVFRKDSPIGIQMFDAIAIACAAVARDALQAASISTRLDELYAAFSNQATRRSPTKQEFDELLRMVSSEPLENVDPRLSSILFDPDKEYGLDWRECCKAMTDDALFFPHWTFSDEQDNMTQNLFYMAAFDEFLSLTVSKDGSLLEARLLWRDRKAEGHEESTIMAGQAFANYLMHYLWHVKA